MAKRPNLPCAGCGKLMWRNGRSLPDGLATCHECRAVNHSYRGGCRCDDCRAVHAAKMRKYAAQYRERTGKKLRSRWPDTPRGWISTKRRQAVYERDGFICHICQEGVDVAAPANSDHAPSLDHVVPRSLGGDHSDENLKCAHRICNARRGARELVTDAC